VLYSHKELKRASRGFTFIELLVVVLIIGILAAIALPQYQTTSLKSRLLSTMPILRAYRDAQDRHRLATDAYATKFSDLDITLGDASCSGTICKIGKNAYFLDQNGLTIYFDTTTNETSKLSMFVNSDPNTTFSQQHGLAAMQFACYDRGVAKFEKACQSVSNGKSTARVDGAAGKIWFIN
jgi:prepilin-type N-terminal cleavage/methylation domain-containing protein